MRRSAIHGIERKKIGRHYFYRGHYSKSTVVFSANQTPGILIYDLFPGPLGAKCHRTLIGYVVLLYALCRVAQQTIHINVFVVISAFHVARNIKMSTLGCYRDLRDG